jgi:hypothetical protein
MPELVYPWKRFWCPRGGQISLADDGFLVDPESEYAKYFASDVVSFDSINDTQCLVLLGEPGIGKSTALMDEFESVRKAVSGSGDSALWFDLRDYSSEDRLERKVFKCDAIRQWRRGQHRLHLFFDSLDEALLRIDNISRLLLSELEDLPTERLRLRIASRPADWQLTLEQGFIKKWGEGEVRVFELAPLRKIDVICAAKMMPNIKPDALVEALVRSDVVPLAIKPVTLKFLMGVFGEGGTLPANRKALYFEGCKRLCEEPNANRRDSLKGRERLTASERLAIAARLAAVTQFSGRAAIWTGLSEGLEPQDVALGALVGGTEGEPPKERDVDLVAIREVLDTGLFSSRGPGRQGWRHQTYAEYLAAYYLNVRDITSERLRSLFLHPDGSGKVIPQLREIAAWLASMNSHVFALLVRADPEVLLGSDLAAASHADRANLARQLLKAFESGDVGQSLWDLRRDFARLDSPELADVVRPYLCDRSRPPDVRIAAIEIARECGLSALGVNLVEIALDHNDPVPIRSHAAFAIAKCGGPIERAALRPLALGSPESDPQDELKGWALAAAWPNHISPDELLPALTPVKDDSFFGAYHSFLRSDIAGQLPPGHIEAALRWAGRYVRDRDELDAIHRLASDILERAVDYLDQPVVLGLLAAALFERHSSHSECNRVAARLRAAGDGPRRAVASGMFAAAAADRHGAFRIMDVCAIEARDVPWLLSELSQAPEEATRRTISELIARRLDPEDVDVFGAVLVAASNDQDLRQAIGPLVEPVYFGTPYAEQMKAHHELFEESHKPNAAPPVVPIAESLTEILKSNDPEMFFQVYCLFRNHKGEASDSTEALPGWSRLSDTTRSQILIAACDYAGTRPPTPEGEWWKDAAFKLGMLAGYGALHLLAIQSPDSLDRLTDRDWEFWARIVVAYVPDGAEASSRGLLLNKAYQRARGIFNSTLSEVIDAQDRRDGQVFVLSPLGGVWSEELATLLRAKIRGTMLKPESFRTVLARLLAMHDVEAEGEARAIATGPIPSGSEGRQRVVFSIVELLSHRPQEWSVIWPLLQANEILGVEVLELAAYEREYNSFATALDEGDIADICIWLSKLGREKAPGKRDTGLVGLVTPAVALGNWWNSLINFLTYKGTGKACNAIRRLIAALPQYPGLKQSLREAEELTRRTRWIPPSPEEVIRIASEPDARLIRNGRELVEVLIESMNRLESLLQGVTPSAEELWDEVPTSRGEERIFRPKGETSLSNHIKRHLDRDLRERGVILNREVEIRAAMGGKKGEDTDILVDITCPKGQSQELERISAVIEVKGCWNPELDDAMRCQLAERYMADSGINHGIYLVGWFMCPQWDRNDYRRGKSPKISLDQARHCFEQQATGLTNDARLIRSFVLNAALR